MFTVPWNEHLSYENAKEVNYDAKLHKHYGSNKCDIIFVMYLLGIILWFLLIVFVLQPKIGGIGWLILMAPFIYFLIAIFSLSGLSRYIENEVFDTSFSSSLLLITIPLIGFIIKDMKVDIKRDINKILLLGTAFLIFAMIEVWVTEKWLSVADHFRSILQTIAMTLVVYSLYYYYHYNFLDSLRSFT